MPNSWLPGTARAIQTRELRARRYRIGDVARLLNEPTHVLRFWEEEFKPWVQTLSSPKGQRIYTEQVVRNLTEIQRLLRQELYTHEGAKRQLRLAAERAKESA